MIRHPECIPKCMQAELVGMPEYSCAVACLIALVREREANREWMAEFGTEVDQAAEKLADGT